MTGGGTGGHVFPALEVALYARDRSVDVAYFGSLRGQEAQACKQAKVPFHGFPSEPIYTLKSLAGLKSLWRMCKARKQAVKALMIAKPDVIFATGGYSAAPVVSAAKALGIPFVLHEQNAVPGRTIRLMAQDAFAVATTFRAAESRFEGCNVIRTGLPVRSQLRQSSLNRVPELIPLILVVGGSQGAQSVNEASLGAAKRMVDRTLSWLHSAGKHNFEAVFQTYERLGLKDSYQVKAFLDGAEMADAYAKATICVARGGAATLAELAAFRLPSVVIPYPQAYANHQYHNACEFELMGAASVIDQGDLHPASLERALATWLDSPELRQKASESLEEWDLPDATDRIFELVQLASERRPN